MACYDSDFLDAVNESVDLLQYVSQSIDLVKRNKNWFGKCPLHVDETPSFSINEDKNYFFCFSCKRGGQIIQFLQQYENLTFDEAVEKASRLASMDISLMCQSSTVQTNRMLKKLNQKKEDAPHPIIDFSLFDKYKKQPIISWLREGIRQEEIELFDIRIDTYSNRIVYPVYDIHSNLINIKGRTLLDDYKKLGLAKYINYFPVGTMDYFQGLNFNLPYILEKKEIIIFESIKSVMKLMAHGINNSVSAEKHTLTTEQIRLLISLGVNVVLGYDNDVSYKTEAIRRDISSLGRFCNVYVLEDKRQLLGGTITKNSPIDCGIEIWEALDKEKKFV